MNHRILQTPGIVRACLSRDVASLKSFGVNLRTDSAPSAWAHLQVWASIARIVLS